jgi:putative transposase
MDRITDYGSHTNLTSSHGVKMHLSRERTIFVCYQFFRQLRNRHGTRKPFYTDGASWYNDACKWLRLKHHVYDTGLNLMERFVQQIKDRTE